MRFLAGLLLCGIALAPVTIATIATVAQAATHYVATSGSRDAAASDPSAPTSDVCKAIHQAKDGDQVWIGEGNYTLSAHCTIAQRRLQILGGYGAGFKERDPLGTISKLAVKKAAFWLGEKADDVSFEGLLIDGGSSDAYGPGVCSECLRGVYNPVTDVPLVMLDKTGRARFANMIFVNAPGGAVAGEVRGAVSFDNVAMVNSRPFALKIAGACGYSAPQCVDLSLKNASFVWAWRQAPEDAAPGGSSVIVGQGVFARIERSVFAYADRVAVELDGNAPQELALASIITFDNRQGDVGLAAAGALKAQPIALVGADVGVRGAGPFGRMERLALPWDPDYLQRYLARAQRMFYGARLSADRAYFLSPAQDAGMKALPGSRLSYEVAVNGGVPVARAPDPSATPEPAKDPKELKAEAKKKALLLKKQGKKNGGKKGKGK